MRKQRFEVGRDGATWAVRDNMLGQIVSRGFATRRLAQAEAFRLAAIHGAF